jgi:hypothetical protein
MEVIGAVMGVAMFVTMAVVGMVVVAVPLVAVRVGLVLMVMTVVVMRMIVMAVVVIAVRMALIFVVAMRVTVVVVIVVIVIVVTVAVRLEGAALAIFEARQPLGFAQLDDRRIARQRVEGTRQKHLQVRPDPEHDVGTFQHRRFRGAQRMSVR